MSNSKSLTIWDIRIRSRSRSGSRSSTRSSAGRAAAAAEDMFTLWDPHDGTFSKGKEFKIASGYKPNLVQDIDASEHASGMHTMVLEFDGVKAAGSASTKKKREQVAEYALGLALVHRNNMPNMQYSE